MLQIFEKKICETIIIWLLLAKEELSSGQSRPWTLYNLFIATKTQNITDSNDTGWDEAKQIVICLHILRNSFNMLVRSNILI